MIEHALRKEPSQYPGGAVAWSQENLLAVGQENSVLIVVRENETSKKFVIFFESKWEQCPLQHDTHTLSFSSVQPLSILQPTRK